MVKFKSSETLHFLYEPNAGSQVAVGLEEGGDMHDPDVRAKHLGDQHLHVLLVDALVKVGHLQLHRAVGDDCGGAAAADRDRRRRDWGAGVVAAATPIAGDGRLPWNI